MITIRAPRDSIYANRQAEAVVRAIDLAKPPLTFADLDALDVQAGHCLDAHTWLPTGGMDSDPLYRSLPCLRGTITREVLR